MKCDRFNVRAVGLCKAMIASMVMFAGVASAQEEQTFRPLTSAQAPASLASELPAGADVFAIRASEVGALDSAGNSVLVELPVRLAGASSSFVTAELLRQTVLTEDAKVVTVGPSGIETPITPSIQTFTGTLSGQPGSFVFLGISAGQAQGWIEDGQHLWVIATREIGGVPVTVVYEKSVMPTPAGPETPSCAGEVIPEGDVAPAPTTDALPTYGERANPCGAYRIALDTDNEYVTLFANAQAATDYAVVLTAASSSIYNRELGMGMRLSYLRVWTTTDPWTATSTSTELTEFRSYWRANMASTTRATAVLLSGRSLGGGIAYLRATCSTNNGYAVTANLGGSFPFPIANNNNGNWDLMVFSHELGHQFGSEHTHNSCAYSPAIDGCGLSPTNTACEAGTQDCTVATAHQGSIMSYCHICSGGLGNMVMTFGPRVISRMTSYIAGLTCGTTLTPPSLTGITQSPSGNLCSGTSVTLTAVATGTELRYQWFRNGGRLFNASAASLTIAASVNGDRYDVMVYSACDTLLTLNTPQTVTLRVGGAAPVITEQPAATPTCPAGPVEVSVVSSSVGPLSYQWQVRDLSLPSTWATITNGPVMVAGSQVATATNSSTATLVLTNFNALWPLNSTNPSRAVRCLVGAGCGTGASTLTLGALVTLCPADVNCDGGIDGADVDAFFALWETGAAGADINGDGGIDGGDINDFFVFWSSGC
jgi:hypothetical protein